MTNVISNNPVKWESKGAESMKNYIKHWLISVPDIQFHSHSLIADENHVVINWIATGTNKNSYMGIPATEKPIKLLGVTISHVKNGNIF